ncbi:LysM peptidoglycan-binding domain-containing protein [bacterium]|nr:LysM peptidoglycan-binding domain-containing protein [bacterium]
MVAAGYGISQLFSDKKDEPAKPIKPLIPITDDDAPAGEQPAQAPAGQAPAGEQPAQAPAGQAPAGEQPAQAPAGQAPAGEAPAQQPTPVTGTVIGTVGTQPGNTLVLPDGNCYIVKKGDCVWNIAKKYLQAKNKDVEGYRPRNAEIARETARMMEINKLQYDNTREKKNYYVNIYPGDILKIEENVA